MTVKTRPNLQKEAYLFPWQPSRPRRLCCPARWVLWGAAGGGQAFKYYDCETKFHMDKLNLFWYFDSVIVNKMNISSPVLAFSVPIRPCTMNRKTHAMHLIVKIELVTFKSQGSDSLKMNHQSSSSYILSI